MYNLIIIAAFERQELMSDIKLFMCCHNKYTTLPPLFLPIQCGSAINPPINGAMPDNLGDNISAKNREYCELTAHYYVWKNITSDYYGFCHYRRFFSIYPFKKPYIAKNNLSQKEYSNLFGTEEQWRVLINSNSLIVPCGENMGLSVYQHYCTSAFHYIEDLDLFCKAIREKAPELKEASEEYLSQNIHYFANMFIMDRVHYFEYCRMLFSVLEYVDSHKTMHRIFQADRTDGYLGEIFTGIYITFCRKNGTKITELTRIDVDCSLKKRLGYAFFPPESKRRFFAKGIAKKLKKVGATISKTNVPPANQTHGGL